MTSHPGVAGWFTGQDTEQFAENVNIVTDSIASSTAMGDLLDVSQAQIAGQFPSFNLISSEVVTRTGQPDLGVLEYTAVQQTTEIRFVQVFGVWNGALVVVTGSTDARLGSEGVERLRPYVLTLAPPA